MARAVPLRHMERAIGERNGSRFDPPALGPNQMQLYSFYSPGIEAGNYTIDVEQNIASQSFEPKPTDKDANHREWTTTTLNIRNSMKKPVGAPAVQEFEVMAPQFAVERSMINSYYPPDGHQDEARVLPHIVLNDAHFPWERKAGVIVPDMCDPDKEKNRQDDKLPRTMRSKTPWIAVLVFDPEELRLEKTYDLKLKDANKKIDLKLDRQAPTGAFSMAIKDYLNITAADRIAYEATLPEGSSGLEELQGSSDAMSVIFPSKSTFVKLFSHINADKQFQSDVESHKYLAHVRAVNTMGFPDSGSELVGNFSIVVSGRTPRLDLTAPTTQICHLVSIENVDSTIKGVFDATTASPDVGKERIAMVSLFSWTYTALPPNPINFVDDMRSVMQGFQMLKPPTSILDKLNLASTDQTKTSDQRAAAKTLFQRLDAGYSLARWRAETGEETAAFSRGPLVPQRVLSPPTPDWCAGSNTSKEFQILDPETGLMDLSYSSAWQLGKTLAIADTSFNGALMRFRSLVYNWAVSKVNNDNNGVAARRELISNLGANVKAITNLAKGNTSDPRRLVPPSEKVLAPHAVDDAAIRPQIAAAIRTAVITQTSAGKEIWNEFSLDKPNNTDWPVISTWISEKLSLADIPAHFLIPDPSFLPNESMRFFHIDRNWLDCLVDGALSVANHLDRDDDLVRTYIKEVYNEYLAKEVGGSHKMQVPFYGLILRSQIVEVMPDMRVTVLWKDDKDGRPDARAPFCRYTKLDNHTLMCLLDRQPEELEWITFAQPPHQQRFSLGYKLDGKGVPSFNLTQLYTQGAPDGEWATLRGAQPTSSETAHWYDAESRMVRIAALADAINRKLTLEPSTDPKNPKITNQAYQDFVPNSAEVAMELNDKAYYFKLLRPQAVNAGGNTDIFENDTRQLWTIETKQWTADPKVPEDTSATTSIGDHEPTPVGQDGAVTAPNTNAPISAPLDPPARAVASTNIAFTNAPPGPMSGSIQGSLQTCFSMMVFADYKGRPKTMTAENAFVPCSNDYLFDLVFSIRKIKNATGQMLSEIRINIPHTGVGATEEPLLEENYDDPRARMLANQRFVVLINRTTTHLQVRLIPRSSKTSPSIPVSDSIKDVSFRLAEAPIADLKHRPQPLPVDGQPKRQGLDVLVKWEERYETGSVPGNGTGVVRVQKLKLDRNDG